MLRPVRLEAPGALPHVIGCEIERQPIVPEDIDRAAFVERLGRVLAATGTPWDTWLLLLHFGNLLCRAAAVPLTTLRRLPCY